MNDVYNPIPKHCNACRYYDNEPFGPVNYGQCRFYPPMNIEKISEGIPKGIWPIVGYDDFCGKFVEK